MKARDFFKKPFPKKVDPSLAQDKQARVEEIVSSELAGAIKPKEVVIKSEPKRTFKQWRRDFWNMFLGRPLIVPIDPAVPMIAVKDYTKKFGRFIANKNVSFQVGHGVIHGFIGPNGSGKTTTMKTLIGAYTLETGTMLINGHPPGTARSNTLIGYIPERASFPAHLSCIAYLTEMGALSGMKYRAARKKGFEILGDLGLKDFARRKPVSFSSGMQKKILLAQALLNDPALLILDEPAANLDPTARKELLDELIKLRDEGKSIFISSHILSELERIIDEVTFLFYGQILFSGDIKEAALKTQRAFFRTSNNLLAKNALVAKGFEVKGDPRTEMYVDCQTIEKTDEVLRILSTAPEFVVNLFKTNDLQSVYDVLLADAAKHNLGAQTIGKKKVKAQAYEKGGGAMSG